MLAALQRHDWCEAQSEGGARWKAPFPRPSAADPPQAPSQSQEGAEKVLQPCPAHPRGPARPPPPPRAACRSSPRGCASGRGRRATGADRRQSRRLRPGEEAREQRHVRRMPARDGLQGLDWRRVSRVPARPHCPLPRPSRVVPAQSSAPPMGDPGSFCSTSPPPGSFSLCFATASRRASPLLCMSASDSAVALLMQRRSARRRSASPFLAASRGRSGTLRQYRETRQRRSERTINRERRGVRRRACTLWEQRGTAVREGRAHTATHAAGSLLRLQAPHVAPHAQPLPNRQVFKNKLAEVVGEGGRLGCQRLQLSHVSATDAVAPPALAQAAGAG